MKHVATISPSPLANVPGVIFINARIASAIFRGCAESSAQWHVWHVAARTMAETLMHGFGYGLWKKRILASRKNAFAPSEPDGFPYKFFNSALSLPAFSPRNFAWINMSMSPSMTA